MTTNPMVERISEHPFLGGLNHKQRTLLADCALPAHFEAG